MLKNIFINIMFLLRFYFTPFNNYKQNSDLSCVIFSKDRPMQLFATLESYFKFCNYPTNLIVLYKISNKKLERSYQELFDEYQNKNIVFIEESNFKQDLINILKKIQSNYIFFLVDDIIFKSYFSFNDYFSLKYKNKYLLSLRLGKNLSYCYTKAVKQHLPIFKNINKQFISWSFYNSELDWKYVFSVDGHVFKT